MVQNLLFPGDNDTLKTAFLKPNGISPATLAKIRLGCFSYMLAQITATGYFSPETNRLFYFTNWSVTANCLSYLILVWAHLLNGDFFKDTYEEVDVSKIDATKRPYYLWSAA